MTQLVLGSQSPRRKEILGYFSLPFTQATPPFDEEAVPYHGNPIAYATELSSGKALSLAPRFSTEIILTADTIVWKEGKLYGKPRNSAEAFEFLSELAGSWHSVFTAVTVKKGDKLWSGTEETRVLFNALSPDEIRHYYTKLHLSDKAGGYAVQMAGGLAINRIEGCYYNVMGLPINTVRRLLLNAGVDLWDYLK